jgi:hypothetical protein
MVDALRVASRWVTPRHGVVIDLRPAELTPYVELGTLDGTIISAGPLTVDDDRRARHAAANVALKEAAALRVVTVENGEQFAFYRYPESLDALRDYIASKWQHTWMDDATYARTRDLLGANRGARLWLREEVGIRTLRPVPAS